MCYDKHTLCEKCRNQVCGNDSFCDECRSWPNDFRRMYVKHQRTLHQKRVSKGNAKAKAKSPPVADDAASNVSIESHVSVPVVILPLDSQSVNIDDNLSNLGNIQNIDNIVEIQQPPPEVAPPPTSVVFDAGTIASVFDRLHNLLSKFEGSSTPQRKNVGSVRRSSTAGPSDNARLNPLTQVTDSAPQGPDAAPGPSKAMHVPPAPGPSHPVAEKSGELPSARVEEDVWEPIRTGSLRDSSPEGLRSSLELVHTKITQHREIIDFTLSRGMSPPAHYYRDLDVLHAEYDHLCQTLVESREASASVAVGILQMSPLQVSLLQLRLPSLHVQILHHAQGFAIHLSLGLLLAGINDSLHKTVLVHETLQAIVPFTVASPEIAHVSDSSLAIILATDGDSLQGIPPLQSVADSLQRIPLRLSIGIHPVPLLVMLHLRDPHHGLLLPIHLLLPGKIGTLMIPPSLPPFGRW